MPFFSKSASQKLLDAIYAREDSTVIRQIIKKHPQAVRKTGEVGSLPIHKAARQGHVDAVRELLAAYPDGAEAKNTYGNLPIHDAAKEGHVHVVRELLVAYSDGAKAKNDLLGFLPVHESAVNGHVEVVRELLVAYPDAARAESHFGRLPIHLAAYWGHEEAVRELLVAYPDGAKRRNDDGKLPADVAEEEGRSAELVAMLRSAAAAPMEKQLVDAIKAQENPIVIRGLIDKDPHAVRRLDEEGNLPLHWAARVRHVHNARELLAAYANAAKARNYDGKLPLDIAEEEGASEELIALLRAAAPPEPQETPATSTEMPTSPPIHARLAHSARSRSSLGSTRRLRGDRSNQKGVESDRDVGLQTSGG